MGIDATTEALEVGGKLGDAFQGAGIVGIGIIGTFLLLDVVGRQQMIVGRSEAGQRMTLATMIAVGIGLHNLGEGLAIGAAYAVGAAALGTFLVVDLRTVKPLDTATVLASVGLGQSGYEIELSPIASWPRASPSKPARLW